MVFKSDIKKALIVQRDRTSSDLLAQVSALLKGEEEKYRDIETRLSHLSDVDSSLKSSASGELFSLEEIRSVAIRYDLRFLDSSLFKGQIPLVGLQTIKRREAEMGNAFMGFKILAPGELFQLEDENADPLLFGMRSDGQYELIAQWGGDINTLRAFRTYPKRNPLTLITSVVLICIALVALLPDQLFQISTVSGDLPMMKPVFFFFVLTFFGGLTSYVWFAFRKQFSSHSWDSKTF